MPWPAGGLMDEWRDFWADYLRCLELDPIQHLVTALAGFSAMGLVWIFWASVRGVL